MSRNTPETQAKHRDRKTTMLKSTGARVVSLRTFLGKCAAASRRIPALNGRMNDLSNGCATEVVL